MTINKSATNVAESVPYNNLIPDVSEYEQGFQPKKPEKKPDYPFELKVHLWRLSEAQAFAQAINKRLSSEKKSLYIMAVLRFLQQILCSLKIEKIRLQKRPHIYQGLKRNTGKTH